MGTLLIAATETTSQVPVLADNLILDSNFIITILAGVILALTFQFILTAISVAAGVTALGDIKKKYATSKAEAGESGTKDNNTYDQDSSPGTPMGVKISTGFGVWSVITTSIALFSATALALNLNVVATEQTNITTALVIWGLFFLILFYLEAKFTRTLIGNLIAAATSGLRNSASFVGSLLTPSPEKKIENVVDKTVDRIRQEFDAGLSTERLSEVLDNFLTKVDQKIPDYEELKNDLEGIAKKSRSKNTAGKWMAVQQILTKMISENSNSGNSIKKGKAGQLRKLLTEIVSKYNESPGKVAGIKNVLDEFTSLEREQIDRRLETLKSYFTSTSDEGLSISKLKDKARELLNDPNTVTALLSENFKQMDKAAILDVLESNTNLKRAELETYADRITTTIESVTKEFDKENENRIANRIEGKVAAFFESTGREELDYTILKNDLKRLMDNPKDSIEIIKKRFATFNNDTLRALVTNNRYVNEKHIDAIIETIENGKKEVMEKFSEIELTANQQMKTIQRKAVIQAEHARATAASAAWWLVLSSILSGVSAILGGLITI